MKNVVDCVASCDCAIVDGHPVTKNQNKTIDSAVFSELSPEDQKKVSAWIKEKLIRRATPNYRRTSYYLRILATKATGVMLTNNQFKDAMLQQGYNPIAVNACFWNFGISEKSPALCKVKSVIRPSQEETEKWRGDDYAEYWK